MDRDDFKLARGGGMAWLECASLARLPWLLHAFSTRLIGGAGGTESPRNRVDTPQGTVIAANDPQAQAAAGLDLSLHFGSSSAAPGRPNQAESNRQRFFQQIGASGFSFAALRQTHSTNLFLAASGAGGAIEFRVPGSPDTAIDLKPETPPSTREPRGAGEKVPPAGDALLADQPSILLSVRVADCMPILTVDPRRRVIAAVHAGWRGALEGIVEKAVGEMGRAFGSAPGDLIVAIGPSIRACCYEVGQEVIEAFHGRFKTSEDFFKVRQAGGGTAPARSLRQGLQLLSERAAGHDSHHPPTVHLNLIAVARHQLHIAGLGASQIHIAPYCTACRTDLFYSYRKEGSSTGRMMAVLGMRRKGEAGEESVKYKG